MSLVTLSVLGAVAVVAGVTVGYLYGRFYRWSMRRNCRRVVHELLRGVERLRTEFELRPDGLWSRTPSAEVSLPWSRLTRVNETDEDVEIWFDPGLAVVRNRAFARSEDRRAFVEAVIKLGGLEPS